MACKEESKCEKVFNCSSECATVNVKKNVNDTYQIKLLALSSGNVVLYLTNATNETIYPDLRKSFVNLSIGQSHLIDYLSLLCGWIYFVSSFILKIKLIKF